MGGPGSGRKKGSGSGVASNAAKIAKKSGISISRATVVAQKQAQMKKTMLARKYKQQANKGY